MTRTSGSIGGPLCTCVNESMVGLGDGVATSAKSEITPSIEGVAVSPFAVTVSESPAMLL